jgi:hypothetical protein
MNPEVIKSPSGLWRSSWNISMDLFFLFSLVESVRTNHFGSESTSPDFIPWLARSRRALGPTAVPRFWLFWTTPLIACSVDQGPASNFLITSCVTFLQMGAFFLTACFKVAFEVGTPKEDLKTCCRRFLIPRNPLSAHERISGSRVANVSTLACRFASRPHRGRQRFAPLSLKKKLYLLLYPKKNIRNTVTVSGPATTEKNEILYLGQQSDIACIV